MPPTGIPSFARSAIRGSMFFCSPVMNSTLLRLVKRRWPSQYFSARFARSRTKSVLTRRGEAARTVKILSPLSATWTITPGLSVSWYFQVP